MSTLNTNQVIAGSLTTALFLSGCATTLLNKNTLDLASSTDDLLQKQVLFNLSNFIDSDLAYPSQVVVNSGTAATTDSFSANAASPLQSGLQATSQAAATIAATVSHSQTHTGMSTRVIPTAGVSGSDSQTQNWSYSAITNPFEAARLMALYRFAVDNDPVKLKRDYPLIYKSITINSTSCVLDRNGRPIDVSASPGSTPTQPTTPVIVKSYTRCATSLGSSGSTGVSQGSQTVSQMIVDPYYLKGPLCVLCGPQQSLHVNPQLAGGWLHWKALPGAARPDNYSDADTPLGQYGHYELYTSNPEKYSKFALFSLAASTLSDTSGSGGGGGGAGSSASQKVQSALTCTTNADGSFLCF